MVSRELPTAHGRPQPPGEPRDALVTWTAAGVASAMATHAAWLWSTHAIGWGLGMLSLMFVLGAAFFAWRGMVGQSRQRIDDVEGLWLSAVCYANLHLMAWGLEGPGLLLLANLWVLADVAWLYDAHRGTRTGLIAGSALMFVYGLSALAHNLLAEPTLAVVAGFLAAASAMTLVLVITRPRRALVWSVHSREGKLTSTTIAVVSIVMVVAGAVWVFVSR